MSAFSSLGDDRIRFKLLTALGRTAYRPAHIHLKLTHQGQRPLTTQIFCLRVDALDLNCAQLRVIRTVVEVSGHTSFKPYPKSSAGRRTVPLPGWYRSSARTLTDTRFRPKHRSMPTRQVNHCVAPCSAPASGGLRS
ncbi:MAG: hypothetical protein ACRDQU_01785 [Pseudonocardiaceae bacterium]